MVHEKSQFDIEREPKTEPKSMQTKDEEEVASQRLRMNDVANTKTEVRHVGTIGEGVEQPILLSCEETTTKDKVEDLRVANTTSRVEEGLRTQLLETLGDEGVNIIQAYMIEEDNGYETYRVDDVAANYKVKDEFVKNTTRVYDDHGETSSNLDPEKWALTDVRPKR